MAQIAVGSLCGRPGGDPDSKNRQQMKMGFVESARRGGSENASFAMYLVKEKKKTMLKKVFGVRVHNH